MQTGTSVFMLTSRNVLMPGVFVGETFGRNGLALLEVQSPSGKVYTANPAHVYDEETGRVMLAHARAKEMAQEGYRIAVRNDGSFRVYQPAKHGMDGGYIVREAASGAYQCHCPATEKNACCKHVQAVCSLLWNKAKNAAERDWKPGHARYENLAVRVAQGHTVVVRPECQSDVAQMETSVERRARLERSAKYDF